MNKIIKIGDIVDIYFEYTSCLFDVTVLELPCQGAEYFTVKDMAGKYHYVGFSFSRMSLKETEDDNR